MKNRNVQMLTIAEEFIKKLQLNVVYASVGGSVGRGEADKYSDLDITVYTDSNATSRELNIFYDKEIIQLEIFHIDELPNKKAIIASPWKSRFINEIIIIKDENSRFKDTKSWATDYFFSDNGRKKMLEQVNDIVQERKYVAFECLRQHKFYSATNASLGAWAEAGFLYLFFYQNSLSTGALIPNIQQLDGHFQEFKHVSPFFIEGDFSDISHILSQFRKFLRTKKGTNEFILSKIQDTICERKIQRLLNKNDYFNLIWQMYGEVFWLYLETSNGLPFEQYFKDLPIELQKGLIKIGITTLEKEQVEKICNLSDELLNICR